MSSQIVATYPLQQIALARAERDALKAAGRKAWLTMELGVTRYGGVVLVHAAPLKAED